MASFGFSLTTGYAVRALCCLGGGDCSTRQIADLARCTGIPRPYLAKVINHLVRAGLVVTKRGYRGGITLTRPADEISLMNIVMAVEGHQWMAGCLLGLACDTAGVCPTMPVWTRLRNELQIELGRLTLADFINSRNAPAKSSLSCASLWKSSSPKAYGMDCTSAQQPDRTTS